MDEELIGEILARLLAQKGMSQRKLANLSGVDRGYINSLINGKGGSISLRIARLLALALDESPEVFLKSFPRQETSEDLLDRLRMTYPATIPVYTAYPFDHSTFQEPIEYVYRDKKKAKKSLEGYLIYGGEPLLNPLIKDGDIIIVDREGEIENGNIVACIFDGKLQIGKLIKVADDLFIENNCGRIKFEECNVAAPVIEIIRKLK